MLGDPSEVIAQLGNDFSQKNPQSFFALKCMKRVGTTNATNYQINTDYCVTSLINWEYSCFNESYSMWRNYNCSLGCSDGACKRERRTVCDGNIQS